MRFLILLLLFASPFALADEVLGKFGDWNLYRYTDSAGDTCTLSSQPVKSAGKYTQRGPVYFHITSRADSDWDYVVSASMGYPIKPDSEITVQIDGGKKFNFYVQDQHSFLNKKQTETILTRLRAGNSMVVKGTSKRGTATTDNFSLKGVTKGFRTMQKLCSG